MAARRGKRVVWSEQARVLLDEILEYVSPDSPAAARSLLEEALATAESLDMYSERGRVGPEYHDDAIRELFVHRYRLIYQVARADVTVLAIIHGARDFAQWRRGQ